MTLDQGILGGALVAALVAYLLLGGADFGGGVLDLFASGPRRAAQRDLIARAIGPIWEANHVWLILAVVILFSSFPRAFWAVAIALHVPLEVFLVGVVLRGSAFTFRAYELRADEGQRRFGLVFSLASTIAPFSLGVSVGAIASGAIGVTGDEVTGGFFAPWLGAFPLVVGLLVPALCALLAASYLTVEAESDGAELADDFRRRAKVAAAVVALLGALALVLARSGAPRIWAGLVHTPAGLAVLGLALGCHAGLAHALQRRAFRRARVLAAATAALVVAGWAIAQAPMLVPPDLSLQAASSHPRVQRLVVVGLALGVPILAPSLWLLYRTFSRVR